jgi:DNA-binding transcriptional LysR family regulator
VRLVQTGEVDIGISSEQLDKSEGVVAFPTTAGTTISSCRSSTSPPSGATLAALAHWPIVTYQAGLTGRARVDDAFAEAGIVPQILLTAQDSDVIKTYVELEMGVGILADMAFDSQRDKGLVHWTAVGCRCRTPPGSASSRGSSSTTLPGSSSSSATRAGAGGDPGPRHEQRAPARLSDLNRGWMKTGSHGLPVCLMLT